MADKTYHASVGFIQDNSDGYDDEDEVLDHRSQAQDQNGDDNDWLCLAPFKRLEKICNDPDVYKRQQVGRTVPGALVSVADSSFDVARILLIINKVSNDPEPSVRQDLAESLPHICLTCHSRDHASQLRPLVLTHLLPLNLRLLEDREIKVRKSAQKSLIVLLENDILDASTIENAVCSHVVSLTEREDEVYHMTAVELMSTMAPLIGPDLTESAFIPKFLALCLSTQLNVRHICATKFGDFCAVVSQPIIEKLLLPSFVRLTLDSMWNVRKACAQVIMSVSCACTLDARKSLLAPIFGRFLADENRWVRVAAFQTLGPFITTFAQPSITGLAYNNSGELVLVNPEGFEFKCPIINESMNNIMNCMEMGLGLGLGNNMNSSNLPSSKVPGSLADDEDDDDDQDNVIDYVLGDTPAEAATTGDVNENYNTFQYWREPIANINEVDDDSTSASNLLKLSNTFDNLCTLVDNAPPSQRHTDGTSSDSAGDDHSHCQMLESADSGVVKDSKEEKEESWEHESWGWNNSDEDSGNEESTRQNSLRCSNDLQDMTPQIPLSSSSSRYPQHIVPQELIDYYVKMFHCGSDQNENSDLARHCAFSLPAVALTLGSPNWCLLRPVTKRLACDEHWKVRRMVAACMHELAVIVGPGAATRDLLPVYTDLIKDLDEVRIGALRILSRFLFLLKPEGRQRFLPMFNKFLATDYEWNWRFRAEFVDQLGLSLGFFHPQQIWDYLAPLALLLLSDKVAAVRRVAIDLVDELLTSLASSPQLTRSLTTTLAEDFAHSPSWTQRQTFASLCARLVTPPPANSLGSEEGRRLQSCAFGEAKNSSSSSNNSSSAADNSFLTAGGETSYLPYEMFACDLLPHLLDLARDPVPNVRLCVARTLALHIAPLSYFQSPCPHSEVLMNTLHTLMSDPDSDVRYYATLKPDIEPNANASTDAELNESHGDSTSSDTSSPTSSKMMKTSDQSQEVPKIVEDSTQDALASSYDSIPHIDESPSSTKPVESLLNNPPHPLISHQDSPEPTANSTESLLNSPPHPRVLHQDSPRPPTTSRHQSNSRKRHRN